MAIKKFFKSTNLVLSALLLMIFPGSAQVAGGKLSGKITDSSSNQSIFGVNIIAKPSNKGVTSITDGTYIMSLTPGIYTVRYSYIGYNTKEVSDIIIKKGETTFMDVVLAPKGNLQAVVVSAVSARKETQSAVYSRQKLLAASSDAIGAEAMRRTPDVNAGQAVARVPGINVRDNRFVVVRGLGDQYNQTMLNGVLMTSTETNRNAFALDLIPTAVLDNITVNKTATPDMPGNFAGGIVQINTKDFPASDFVSVLVGAGFSDETIGKDFYSDKRRAGDKFGSGAKGRDLPANFPSPLTSIGSLYGFNTIEQHRYLRMLDNNLAPINNGPSRPNENVQLGFGKTIKFKNQTQAGIVLAVTQRKTELIENEISSRDPQSPSYYPGTEMRGAKDLIYYANTNNYKYSADLGGVLNLAYSFGKNKITFKNLYSQILKNFYTERPKVSVCNTCDAGFPNGNSDLYGITYFTEQKQILNTVLAGEHRTGKDNNTRLEWNINATINNTNTPDTRNFLYNKDSAGILSLSRSITSIDAALQQGSRVWSRDRDYIYGGAFNITTGFDLLGTKQLLKTGILFQNRARKSVALVVIYQGLGSTLDSLLRPSQFYSSDPNGPGLSLSSGTAGSNGTYNSGSSLLAAYESLESKIGSKTRIIWGIRTEKYQQYVNVFDPIFYPNISDYDLNLTGVTARTTFNFLPSVNIVYALTKKINIRGAFSQTVIRPELKDLAEFTRYDYQSFRLSQGNAQLRSTRIKNYDVKFEFFPSGGEIISFSAFYKQLKDPIEYVRNSNSNDKFLQPLNVGSAFVRGVEVEVRKKVDFIAAIPWLKNVLLFGNGTLLKSKVATQQLNDFFFPKILEHTLTGQPSYIINAGVTVSAFKNSFETTVSFNRTGDYIYQLGSADKLVTLPNGLPVLITPHSRVNPRNMMDITVSQDLFKNKCRIKVNLSNVLKSRYIIYQDVNDNGKFDEPYVLATNSGIDATPSSLNAQRTWSFSVAYTF